MTKQEIRAELKRLGKDDSDASHKDLEQRLKDAKAEAEASGNGDQAEPGGEGANAPEELTDEQKAATLGDDPEGQIKATGVEDGFLGTKVDPRDNEEYSLESGPSSPSALEGMQAAAAKRVEDLEASSK